MYISDLAKKLKLRDKDLKQKIKSLGYVIKPRVRTIDDDIAKEILEKLGGAKKPEEKAVTIEGPVEIEETVSVGEFAKKAGRPASDVIMELMKNGVMANINQDIDFDTATIVADSFGLKTKLVVDQQKEDREKGVRKRLQEELDTKKKNVKDRPPVVTIMGHVDHGKTTLIDAIRETNVVAGESGGITQHIGAYQAQVHGKTITILDTPGHEAFSAIRARGAKVTDVAILIVAADDGVKPQTKEAVELIKKAGVPYIVAINKIDKPEANPDRVKKELADIDVLTEEWGGDVVTVEISAKEKQNLEALLEMIILVSEIEDLKALYDVPAVGTIIEQKKDPRRGSVATVLVQNGTLKLSDFVTVGSVYGTIRSMENFQGKKVDHAKPSTPVQILGLEKLPQVGDILHVIDDKQKAKIKINQLKKQRKEIKSVKGDEQDMTKKLNLIIKSDVQGSLDAIIDSINQIESEQVKVEIIDDEVGKATESDVMLADSTSAKIMLFNVAPTSVAKTYAREKQVVIEEFNVIYELIDRVKEFMNDLIEPVVTYEEVGKLNVLAIFRTERGKMIVGGKVISGKMIENARITVMRGEEEVGKGEVISLQSGKSTVKQVEQGNECGITFKGEVKIKEGDTLLISEKKVHQEVIK